MVKEEEEEEEEAKEEEEEAAAAEEAEAISGVCDVIFSQPSHKMGVCPRSLASEFGVADIPMINSAKPPPASPPPTPVGRAALMFSSPPCSLLGVTFVRMFLYEPPTRQA